MHNISEESPMTRRQRCITVKWLALLAMPLLLAGCDAGQILLLNLGGALFALASVGLQELIGLIQT